MGIFFLIVANFWIWAFFWPRLYLQAHNEAQRAAARFEKASNAHEAAKEMVTLAEEGYKEKGCLGFDQAWQEMLNHASSKVSHGFQY